ncbi:hypothetical protein N7532_000582 [Penicillium argentinense]|uniref:Origin recognition complex subunit 4 n=1 Tax=Penicillium argentinense TaxID=1131581 RepID=A0A9W9G6Z9_9EURO|nr:uncharacterized protein N7532_000582 [Penicillium argentinense]KAJ5112537.1 hypothetical protein N7532_000582 [Penicillium argentinense]
MREPRASKRRRVSEEPVEDDDGDIAMESDAAYSEPSSPAAGDDSEEDQDYRGPRQSVSRRRSTRGRKNVPTGLDEDGNEKAPQPETPSRGTRASGRQRKTPAKLEGDAPAATPRSGRGVRSVQKSRRQSVDESDMDIDIQSPQPKLSVSRTRSRRSTARNKTNGTNDEGLDRSPSPAYHDGLDDLIAMQLQQDLQKQQEVQQEITEVVEAPPEYVEKLQTLCQDGYHDEIRVLSSTILEKLTGKRQIPLKGLENEYNKVNHLIEQTVTVGEGNSMLLLGSRGCGKTAMVETILSSLAKEHSNDFHVVRLNGFLHTDDRLALREMWRQLGRETNTEDDASKVSSYADTMATLLALLSHPEELFGANVNGNAVTAAKSIVILLDEFDLFVTHPRQTLLYNLFDIAQARKAPIAVIGLTTKVDVTEMLEKRVKSRFSHRYVYIPLPRTYDIFSEICMASLDLNEEESQQIINLLCSENPVLDGNNWTALLGGWQEYLKSMWQDKDFQFHLKRIYNQTKSVKEFFTSALLPITDLHLSTHGVDQPTLQIPTPKSFTSQTLSCPDPAPLPFSASVSASSSSSSLPLALLVAATRLAALFDPGNEGVQAQSLAPLALSFPAAYAEYVRLLTTAKTSASVSGAAATAGRVWGRDVSREAWEKLVTWGLVTPVGSGNGTADGQMFRVEISFEEVIDMAGSGGSLGQWWRDG